MQPEKTKFRSLEEVRRYLKVMQDQLRMDEQLVDKTNKQLAKIAATKVNAAEFKFLDISGDGPAKKKSINVDFPVVKVPDAKTLSKNYKLTEKLSEQYKYVINLENEVKLNFAGTNHTSIDATLGAIQKLKADLERNLKSLFLALAQVAEGHAPKEYKRFVATLAEEISNSNHIECESAKTITYAALENDGTLVFAGYIILINAVSDEEKVAPTLYIVLKWTVGGDVEVFVEHEFVAPSMLDAGTVIENVHQAAKAVANQLSLEGFSSQIGNLPAAMQLRAPAGGISGDLFSAAPYIQSVTAEQDELIFTLKPKTTKAQIEQIKNQLYLEVKALLKKKKGTTVRMRVQNLTVTFNFIGLDHSDGIHPHDLDWIGDKYKLSDAQLRKITNVINTPSHDDKTKSFEKQVKQTVPNSGPLWHPPGRSFKRE